MALIGAGVLALAFPAGASAIADPQQAIGGSGSKWFSGSLIQQIGENCSVFGSPYTEVMVSGVGSYGGAPGGGVPRVGDPYWVSLLVSIPGNPCGSGSSSVVTDLALPAHTAYDPSRQIRCFGTNRFSDDFFEITNQSWNFLGHSGPYCPSGPSHSAPIGDRYGFRPLANGQMFWIFVPVVTSSPLNGAGGSHEFNWLTQATGVYANPGRSYIWANVFSASAGSGPFVYFAHDPAAVPFWQADAPGLENRVEFFANVFTDGHGGYLHYEIRRTDTNALIAEDADDTTYDGTVAPGGEVVQVMATGPNAGPNGGYVPFAFHSYEDVPMRITWDFTYNSGSSHATDSADFRTLSGPDSDGDGVEDASDQCPNVKGTLANGCLPSLAALNGGVALQRGARLKRSKLARGLPVGVSCTRSSTDVGVLTLKRKVAKQFGLPTRIGSGKGSCLSAGGSSFKLKLTAKAAKKLKKARKPVPATLTVTFSSPSSPAAKVVLPVKILRT